MSSSSDIAVYIEPISYHFREDRLFFEHPYGEYNEPFAEVMRRFAASGIEVHTADLLRRDASNGKTNLYFSHGNVDHYRRIAKRNDTILSGLFHFESPIVHPSVYRETPKAASYFRRVYSFSTGRALAAFGCEDVPLIPFCIPQPYDGVFERLWAKRNRRYLVLVSQNKLPVLSYKELYTERLRALEYFGRTNSIDLYGIGWDRMPFLVGERRVSQHLTRIHRFLRERLPFARLHDYEQVIKSVYRGPAESKYETMSNYTFALCYENMSLDGWINEKLFDALIVGAIPIFLGAPDVADYVSTDCFIDRRQFETYEDLDAYLRSLDDDAIQEYREAGRRYLESTQYDPFRKSTFADIFAQAVKDDVGIAV
jgi:hypothetical protein